MGDPKRKHGSWKGPHPRPNSLQTNKHGQSRQPSYDSIQGRVQREGITARNLIKYNVPLENGYPSDRPSYTSGRARTPSSSYSATGVKKSPSATSPRKSVAPMGVGQMRPQRRPRDDRARYWGHMLDTLKRTIDEIYTACEEDESEMECREVILILEHSKKDFHSLIEKMNLLREYENADEGQRPTSLAWDERKTSPGKPIMKQVMLERTLTAAAAKVAASTVVSPQPAASAAVQTVATAPAVSNGDGMTTWADRVRGAAARPKVKSQTAAAVQPTVNQETAASTTTEVAKEPDRSEEITVVEEDDDGGGWERVEKRPRGGSKSKTLQRRSPSNSSNTSGYPMKANSHPVYWRNGGSNGGGIGSSSNSSTTSTLHLRLRSESCSSNGSNLRRGHSMSETNISVRSDGAVQQPRGHHGCTSIPLQNLNLHHATDAGDFRSRSSTSSSREISKEKELLSDHLRLTSTASLTTEETVEEVLSARSDAYSDIVKFGRNSQEHNSSVMEESLQVDVAEEETENNSLKPLDVKKATEPGDTKTEVPDAAEAETLEEEKDIEKDNKDEEEEEDDEKKEKVEEEEEKDKKMRKVDEEEEKRKKKEKVDEEEEEKKNDDVPKQNEGISPGGSEETRDSENPIDSEDEEEESPNLARARRKYVADAYDAEAEDGGESGTATTPYTSVDFTSGEEEEDWNLRKIDKELADAEDEESALTTQLESEEQSYLLQVDAAATAIASTAFETPLTWEEIVEEQKRTGGISWDLIASLDPDCQQTDEDTPGASGGAEFAVGAQTGAALVPGAVGEGALLVGVAGGGSSSSSACGTVGAGSGGSDKFRTPGRGVQMHERLSSPSRKRSAESGSLRQLQEKQDKAKQLRSRVIGARTDKIRELMHKVEEAREHKEELLREKKQLQVQRMQKAELKRRAQLERKIRKAHDEETKGREIAFIQSLEQEQKHHNILAKHQESEQRLQEMQEERRRKQEEKAVREAAAEERRRMLDESRQARLLALQQRRESREREIASRAFAREKSRLAAARAKELERESKIAAMKAQKEQQIEDLKVKIQKKQEETERRHLEQLREISRKAFEMSVMKHSTEDADDAPPIEPYASNKWCTVCHTMINSEVILQSHLRGKKHLANLRERMETTNWEKSEIERFNLEHIVDAPKDEPDPKQQADKERKKNMKKRIKKLKQRMSARGAEFVKDTEKPPVARSGDSAYKPKLVKFVKEVNRYLAIGDNGPWVQRRVSALDKSMGEALRCLEAKLLQNQNVLIELNGDSVLCNVISLIDNGKPDQTPLLPERSFQLTCQVYQAVCANNWNSSFVALFSNRTSLLVEALAFRLGLFITDGFGRDPSTHQLLESSMLPSDIIAVALMETLEAILSSIATRFPHAEENSDACSGSGDAQMNKDTSSNSSKDLKTPSVSTPTAEQLSTRIQDFVSYLVCLGVLDRLTIYLSNVRGPLDSNCKAATFVRVSLNFLESVLKLMALKYSLEGRKGRSSKQSNDDPTQLLSTVLATDLFGLVSLLYGMLLHSGAPSKRDTSPSPLADVTQSVTMGGLRLINAMAELNLSTTQIVLGEEGTVLQLRHIFSYLLWYCGHMSSGRCASVPMEISWRPLLHEVVLCVGHFTVGHTDNQNCLQSGQSPTVLQLLCQLPFEYFSDRRRTQVLYPTLIAACYENDANSEIVRSELSLSLLAIFLEEHLTKESEGESADNEVARRDKRMELRTRFPRALWSKALTYFSS